jgi:N-formylglutamate deformylase
MQPFKVILPEGEPLPVLISIPHCGTAFPDDLADAFKPHLLAFPDDTDWYLHHLYSFAPAVGITVLHAVYSRWVIDLNRPPDNKPLYHDGRLITGLCPVTTFTGEPLYRDERKTIPDEEVQRRLQLYYEPYHQKLSSLLHQLKTTHGRVLLWDAHSIRRHVPAIRAEAFPDLILGDAGGTAASPGLIEAALRCLESAGYSLTHNLPFSGGYITRWYGLPAQEQHALQLEMSKTIYMDDAERTLDTARAHRLQTLLRRTLEALAERLMEN